MADANLSNAALGLHPNAINLIGQSFGRLKVIGLAGRTKGGNTTWKCSCKCGNVVVVASAGLRHHMTRSCGCLRHDNTSSVTHGMRHTPEWDTWQHVIARCENKSDKRYDRYGGRGIKVCPRWRESFEAFYADMGPRPSKAHSIERKDNDGDYCKDNCIWATPSEQSRNRRTNRKITHNGETLLLCEWSERTGISANTIYARIKLGWTIERALSQQVQ